MGYYSQLHLTMLEKNGAMMECDFPSSIDQLKDRLQDLLARLDELKLLCPISGHPQHRECRFHSLGWSDKEIDRCIPSMLLTVQDTVRAIAITEEKIRLLELTENHATEDCIPGQTVIFAFVFPSLFEQKCSISA